MCRNKKQIIKLAIQNGINPTINPKSKPIDIKYHHIREVNYKG